MKYGSVSLGQVEAAINKLGGQEVWDAWLRGEKIVTIEDAVKMFFDKHCRRIPEDLQSNVCDTNRDFRLDQPKMEKEVDYANRIMRLHGCLGVDTEIIAEQLKTEAERLLALIQDNSQIANIANGVCLPVILTKRHSDDIGEDMEWQLEGVGKSYVKTFPDREFYNHRKGTLAGQVEIVKESGYQVIWDKKVNEHIIALFFPNSLQGYSIFAQREQMATLSKFGFILSGAIEPMIMYPDVLARDYNTPGLDLAAFSWQSWQSADYSLRFEADDGKLYFDGRDYLALAYVNYSGGLFFCG